MNIQVRFVLLLSFIWLFIITLCSASQINFNIKQTKNKKLVFDVNLWLLGSSPLDWVNSDWRLTKAMLRIFVCLLDIHVRCSSWSQRIMRSANWVIQTLPQNYLQLELVPVHLQPSMMLRSEIKTKSIVCWNYTQLLGPKNYLCVSKAVCVLLMVCKFSVETVMVLKPQCDHQALSGRQ